MLPRDQASLLDIIEQIRVIRAHLAGFTREDFMSDLLRQDAVMLRVAIIGEAATRLSNEFRAAHPEVPWKKIRDMRNFLIHVYDKVDYAKVWDTVQQDMTPLLIAVERIIAEDATSSGNL